MPAVYYAAMRAGLIVVPLDLRMTPEVIKRIAEKSDSQWLAIGSGFDAPDANDVGLDHLGIRTVEWLTDDPAHQSASQLDEGGLDDPFPDDWEAQVDSWERPTRDSLFEVIYTSGTTGHPKGVMLKHGTILASLEATASAAGARASNGQPPARLPSVRAGAGDVLRHDDRRRHPVPQVAHPAGHLRGPPRAARDHDDRRSAAPPAVLDGIEREVKRQGKETLFNRSRRMAQYLPYWARRMLFRRIHTQLGGALNLFASAGAYLPPDLQKNWESLGVIVIQGYGATECGPASATTEQDHPTGSVGKTLPPVEVRLEEGTKEILVRGPTVFDGYWKDPDATAAVMADGWYRTGDVGYHDSSGNLVLSGRTKNIIVLPNGLNVFPEDIENALSEVGLQQAVVVETAPGRIEAIVLSPDAPPMVTATSPAPGRAADRRGDAGAAEADRAADQGGQRPPLAASAHQRLPHLAGGRFPTHPHAQDQAIRGAALGGGRCPTGAPGHARLTTQDRRAQRDAAPPEGRVPKGEVVGREGPAHSIVF